jgi:1,2-phenylacetyl-CoA epoxidase PaaB subunit
MPKNSARMIEPDCQKFEVFGRWEHDGPLSHLGSLEAPNLDLAYARSMMIYSERPWVELCFAPANSFVKLIGHEKDETVGFA